MSVSHTKGESERRREGEWGREMVGGGKRYGGDKEKKDEWAGKRGER